MGLFGRCVTSGVDVRLEEVSFDGELQQHAASLEKRIGIDFLGV